jgi:hypothetical protein
MHKRWSQNNLEAPLEAVRAGESQRNASARFEIPRRTLRRYISNGISTKRLGGPSVLTLEQEKDFLKRIIRYCPL